MKANFIGIILLSLHFFTVRAFAQTLPHINGDEADISLLKTNSGDLLDRGSSFVNSSFIKGAVNISDYSGNMTIGHALEISYPNDLKTKLTLVFNSNACHAYFEDFVGLSNKLGDGYDPDFRDTGQGTRENGVNAALWIFGINGIAVQTTNFEKNFFLGATVDPDQEDGAYSFHGTQVPLLATGYQYTNDINFPWNQYERKRLIGDEGTDPPCTRKDAIRIMNSEGSVLSLVNPTFFSYSIGALNPNPLDNHLKGMYFDADEQSNGYAIIDWLNPSSETLGLRKVYYKPGDGLTYYFEEEYVNYQDYTEWTQWGDRGSNRPKIAYLRQIRSQNGDRIVFTYDFSNVFGVTNVTRGRKFLKKIQYWKDNTTPVSGTEITFSYVKSGNSYRMTIHSNLSGEEYAVELVNCNPANDSNGFNNLDRNDTDTTRTNIMQVSSITNSCNSAKKVKFTYDNHYRQYTYCAVYCNQPQTTFPDAGLEIGAQDYYCLQYATRILTSRELEHGEKNDFAYWTDYELGSSIPLYDPNLSYSVGSEIFSRRNARLNDDTLPKEYRENKGYHINAYSNNPNRAWYANRFCDDIFIWQPLPNNEHIADTVTHIWYRYFEGYHFRNMCNTMRDNYTATMVKTVTNSIYTPGGLSPVSRATYDYTWGKRQYNSSTPATNQIYNDLSARITDIVTTITTENLTPETGSSENKYIEKKTFELLKTTSKFRIIPSLGCYYGNNFTSVLKLVSDNIYGGSGHILQSTQYNYNVNDAQITSVLGKIVNNASQFYYNLQSPTDLTLASKVISYIGITKATVYSSDDIKQYQYLNGFHLTNIYDDVCLINNLLSNTSTVEETYRISTPNMLRAKTVNSYTEKFGIDSTSISIGVSTRANNPDYVYRPCLPSEVRMYVQQGASGTYKRKSRQTTTYSSTTGVEYGRVCRQAEYGATDNDSVWTTYAYNTGGDYKGYLKQKTFDNGSNIQYSYNGEVNAVGNILCNENTVLTNLVTAWNGTLQSAPFKTVRNYDGRSLTTFTAYDGKGNLAFSVDENGYYSTYIYDGIGRLRKEFKPGAFDRYVNYYISLLSDVGQGSGAYEYNDLYWTPEVTAKAYRDDSGTCVTTLSRFVPLRLAYEKYAVPSVQRVLKSVEKVNYLGRKWYSEDGDGNKVYYYYDKFMNLSRTRFTADVTSAPSKMNRVDYGGGSSYFKRADLFDENGNEEHVSYDLFGNLLADVKYLGTKALQTLYTYDNLGRLQTVTTPEGKATSYAYDDRGNVSTRTSPDAGTTYYLYDKYHNVRLVKDANHSGSNSWSIPANLVEYPYSQTYSRTMSLPGYVWINMVVYGMGGCTGSVTVKGPGGVTYLNASCSVNNGNSYSRSLYLPRGTYQFAFSATGNYGELQYDVSVASSYEFFIYNKYDRLNRLVEEGEYTSGSSSGAFTQGNADDSGFPNSGTVPVKKFHYDIPSSDPIAAGQRNLRGRVSETESYRLGSRCSQTFYSYNELGLVEWKVQRHLGYYEKKLYYWYDLQGNVVRKGYVDLSGGCNMYTFYDYDQEGRLLRVWTDTNLNGTSKVKEAEYSYTNGDRVSQLKLGSVPAQTVDYAYNNRGWLTSINNPDNMGSDKFTEILGYNTRDKVANVFSWTAQYNGNISWLAYRMAGVNNTFNSPYYGSVSTDYVGRVFTYDGTNRLTQAPLGYHYGSYWFSNGNYYSENYSYDDDGNFNTLARYNNNGGLSDNLTYNYGSGSNKLNSVTNSVGSGSSYTYDANGNVTSDSRRGIAFIQYDINNLPVAVYKTNGEQQIYSYDVYGSRVRKTIWNGAQTFYLNDPTGKTEMVQKGVYNYVYTYNIWGLDNIGQVQRNGSSQSRYYYLKDHLGSIRMIVNTSGNAVGYNDYYPFGMTMPGRSMTSSADGRYQFTGKERDVAETGLDYFGARYYDSWRGQWLSVDPMGEKYPGWSAYDYGADNPIKFIDADGRWIYVANGNSTEIFRIPYGVNGKPFPNLNGFEGWQKNYIDLPPNHNEIRNELNGFYADYAEKAPRVAEFLKNTTIPVALFQTNVNDPFQGYSDYSESGGILVNSKYLADRGELRRIVFHELVTSMLKTQGEFEVFAAEFAAGYKSEEQLTTSDWEYWQRGMNHDRWGKYFDEYHQLRQDTKEEFWKRYREYGNSIIQNQK